MVGPPLTATAIGPSPVNRADVPGRVKQNAPSPGKGTEPQGLRDATDARSSESSPVVQSASIASAQYIAQFTVKVTELLSPSVDSVAPRVGLVHHLDVVRHLTPPTVA